ncbi:Inositol-tetrakisphosphate 1-kinase 3-like protein [Drosera capensis]
MLQDVAALKLADNHGRVCVPRQLVIERDSSTIPNEVTKAGLRLPLGGVMFKVYVVGETITVVRWFSLPDVCKRELSKHGGVFPFPRVSCAAASADNADLDPVVAGPPAVQRDIIREHETRDVYYHVIDINYFPGYGKMPDYEHIFTDFLTALMRNKSRILTHQNGS